MMESWFTLVCPMCRTRLRIKSAYTHMRGACPVCGLHIEPPHPKPLAISPAASAADELGQEDEEWPEPAVVVQSEEKSTEPTYTVNESGDVKPVKKEEEPEPAGVYSLAFEADSPKTAGITRSAEWDQPGSVPPSVSTPPKVDEKPKAPTQEGIKKLGDKPAADIPQSAGLHIQEYETIVDPLFGDEVKIRKAGDQASAGPPLAKPPPLPVQAASSPPVARLATIDDLKAVPPAGLKKPASIKSASVRRETKPATLPSPAAPSRVKAATDSEGVREPGELDSPTSDVHLYQLNEAELNPRKADPPPSVLFFTGIFNFPWRLGNWVPWIWLSIGYTLLALLLFMIFLLAEKGPAGIVGAGAFAMAAFLISVWTFSYSGVCLLTVVSETATGNDRIEWPQESWRETFFPSMKVVYYYLVATLMAYPMVVLGVGQVAWQAFTFLLFPAFLFSGLASVNSWNFLHAGVLETILKKFPSYVIMYTLSLAIMGIGGVAMIYAVQIIWLVPIAGILFAACWLIYCRILGRMAMTLNAEAPAARTKKRKKKKKKRPLEQESTDQGEESGLEEPLQTAGESISHRPAILPLPASATAAIPKTGSKVNEKPSQSQTLQEPDGDIYSLRD
jgi:hypothetical protein